MVNTTPTEPQPDKQYDPSLLQRASQTIQDPSFRNNFMRSFNGAMGYVATGANIAAETPGVLPKIVSGALIAKGLYENVEAFGNATTPDMARNRLRERIFMFADSLVDNNSGKMNLVSRLKRRTGEEILNFRDQEFSTRFNRMMGGMFVLMAGVQFAEQPGTINKIIGITLGNIGMAEQLFNTEKIATRTPVATNEAQSV